MTYEVKTPLAISCTNDGKHFWGFNAELMTQWQNVLSAESLPRLRVFDHQCINTKKEDLALGLQEAFRTDLLKAADEFNSSLVKAWLVIEPDQMLQIL